MNHASLTPLDFLMALVLRLAGFDFSWPSEYEKEIYHVIGKALLFAVFFMAWVLVVMFMKRASIRNGIREWIVRHQKGLAIYLTVQIAIGVTIGTFLGFFVGMYYLGVRDMLTTRE